MKCPVFFPYDRSNSFQLIALTVFECQIRIIVLFGRKLQFQSIFLRKKEQLRYQEDFDDLRYDFGIIGYCINIFINIDETLDYPILAVRFKVCL